MDIFRCDVSVPLHCLRSLLVAWRQEDLLHRDPRPADTYVRLLQRRDSQLGIIRTRLAARGVYAHTALCGAAVSLRRRELLVPQLETLQGLWLTVAHTALCVFLPIGQPNGARPRGRASSTSSDRPTH